jgi:hypothetical protein
MESAASLERQMVMQYEERQLAFRETARRVIDRVLGCWQHDLSRPFTNGGRTYRVCLKCGVSRKFDPVSWKTYRR